MLPAFSLLDLSAVSSDWFLGGKFFEKLLLFLLGYYSLGLGLFRN